MQKISVYPGFNENIMKALRQKVALQSDQERLYAVVMDEMAIKEALLYNAEMDALEGFEDFGRLGKTKFVANHALVFMVRGLTSKWKQPVGYFLSSGPMTGATMKELLCECIQKVTDVGLNVKVLIGDQGSNNRNLFEKVLGASPKKPYFTASEKKVFVLYDPPHLLKSIRNNLKKHGFSVNGVHVLWKYIEQFYQADSKLPIRMAPKLTSRHIDLPPFAPLRVKLATEVLSHSVAAGISTLCSLKALPQEAQHTAEFVERMDQLFNVFNSSTLSSTAKMRYAMSENSKHKEFLADCLEWLSQVRSLGSRQLPCISGWKMAITCLMELWDELHGGAELSFLMTDRLNQDCIENLFSTIRGKGGHRDNPDAVQFRTAFRQIMVDKILKPTVGANCKEDLDTFLLTLRSVEREGSSDPTPPAPSPVTSLSSSVQSLLSVCRFPVQSVSLSVVEGNIAAYIAGYLCRKICPKVCQVCSDNMQSSIDPNNPVHTFLATKNYGDTLHGGLTAPSRRMYEAVKLMEEEFRQVVESVVHMDKVRYRLVTALHKKIGIGFACSQCDCEALVLNLFVTVRLHHSLKESNKATAGKGHRNRKVMKFSHM